jgi:hypothetical protein
MIIPIAIWLAQDWNSVLVIAVSGLITVSLLLLELLRSRVESQKTQDAKTIFNPPIVTPLVSGSTQPTSVSRSGVLPPIASPIPLASSPPALLESAISTSLPSTNILADDILSALEQFEVNMEESELRGLKLPTGWIGLQQRALRRELKCICTGNSVVLQVFDEKVAFALKVYSSLGAHVAKSYLLVNQLHHSAAPIKRYLVEAKFFPEALRVPLKNLEEQRPAKSHIVAVLRMQWVTDLPLHEFVERNRPGKTADPNALVRFARELRRMFELFHSEELIHADYGNKNICVQHRDDVFIPLLLDYDALTRWTLPPSPSLFRTRGQSGFVHPARLRNAGVIQSDLRHTDTFSELVLYLSVLSYLLLPNMPKPEEDAFGFAPLITRAVQRRQRDVTNTAQRLHAVVDSVQSERARSREQPLAFQSISTYIPELVQLGNCGIPGVAALTGHLTELLDSDNYPKSQLFIEELLQRAGLESFDDLERAIENRLQRSRRSDSVKPIKHKP